MNSIICMQYFENYFQKKQLIKTKLHGYGMHKWGILLSLQNY